MVNGPITIDIDEQNIFKNYLKDVFKSVDDLRFSMGESARIIKQESVANFILKGSGQYAPLSQIYLSRKRVLSPGSPILVGAKAGTTKGGALVSGGGESGKMRDSIINKTADSVLRIGKKSLEVGTKAKSSKGAPYPVYVHYGTRKMQSRPALFLTPKMVKRMINTFDSEIASKWADPKKLIPTK